MQIESQSLNSLNEEAESIGQQKSSIENCSEVRFTITKINKLLDGSSKGKREILYFSGSIHPISSNIKGMWGYSKGEKSKKFELKL